MSTIVAISTPRGRGALGIIRLSGADALRISRQIAGLSFEVEPRRPTLQNLKDSQTSEIIDQALITYFKAPYSLTGEDVVEVSCHGSPVVLRRIIDLALSFGARLAGPGEFTLRALSNGKLNLAQAEAIRDLISSQTEAAARQAARQLNGELAAALEPLKNTLIEVIVLLESAIEFVEDDLPPPLLQDGIKLTIVGSPNVGKSSLFNRLLARERAIVSDMPGTTRDTLSEPVDMEGVPVLLSDTAGLRETPDRIESLGIQRTHRSMSDADLVMVVVDGSVPIGPQDLRVLTSTQVARRILVLNKCDLPRYQTSSDELLSHDAIHVSALTGEGLDNLRTAILEMFDMTMMESGNLLVTNARHHDLLRHAHRELKAAEVLLSGRASEELVLEPLHNALRFLGEITGETTTEEILSQIFATFCIGK